MSRSLSYCDTIASNGTDMMAFSECFRRVINAAGKLVSEKVRRTSASDSEAGDRLSGFSTIYMFLLRFAE